MNACAEVFVSEQAVFLGIYFFFFLCCEEGLWFRGVNLLTWLSEERKRLVRATGL